MTSYRTLIGVAALVAACLATAAIAAPDWNRTDDPMRHALGLHAGKIGGTGLAFKSPLLWFLQVQGAGAVWNTKDDRRHDVGLEIHYLLRQDPMLRLYLVTGVAHYSHAERKTRADGSQEWEDDDSTNAGFGVGIERLIGERWAVKVDLDFTYENDDETLRPWPQAGLFFYW